MRDHSLERPWAPDAWGVVAGILSAAMIGGISLLIHREALPLPAAEITFVRAMIGLLVTLPWVWRSLPQLARKELLWVWVRALAGAVSIQCFTWNLQNTSIGLANVLFNVSQLIIIGVGFVGGETPFRRSTVIAMMLTALGSGVFWYADSARLSHAVLGVGLVGAIAASIAYTALKKATRVAKPWLINWVVCAASIPVSLLSKSSAWNIPTPHAAWILGAIGLGVLTSQYLLIISFARLPLSLATALTPSCIVWSVVGEAATSGIAAAWQGIVGAVIYAAGLAQLTTLDQHVRKSIR